MDGIMEDKEIKLLSPGREKLAREIIARVGEPIDMKDPEKMTKDEAVLVLQYLTGVDRQRALFIMGIIRGEIEGDVITQREE